MAPVSTKIIKIDERFFLAPHEQNFVKRRHEESRDQWVLQTRFIKFKIKKIKKKGKEVFYS